MGLCASSVFSRLDILPAFVPLYLHVCLQEHAKALLGDFEVPGVDWFEAVEKACEKALKTKALITVRSKRSSDDVGFIIRCACCSSSLQGPIRLTVLAVRPDDTDVVIIDAPPAKAEVVPTVELPEPVIIDGWPVILIVPPPKDDNEPLWSTPLETKTDADIKVKLEPESTSERSPKRESAPELPSTPTQPIPGPSPKKQKARK